MGAKVIDCLVRFSISIISVSISSFNNVRIIYLFDQVLKIPARIVRYFRNSTVQSRFSDNLRFSDYHISANSFRGNYSFWKLDCVNYSREEINNFLIFCMHAYTDYERPERKQPSLNGRKFNPNPKVLGMWAAHFVCHIGPIFQISLIYAFIGCPQSMVLTTFQPMCPSQLFSL